MIRHIHRQCIARVGTMPEHSLHTCSIIHGEAIKVGGSGSQGLEPLMQPPVDSLGIAIDLQVGVLWTDDVHTS